MIGIRRHAAQALSAKIQAERTAQQEARAERARQAQLTAEASRKSARADLATQNRQAVEQKRQKQADAAAQRREQAAAVAPKTAAASNGKRAVVQAGAYQDKKRVQQVQQELSRMGYGTSVEAVQTAKGTLYRVKTKAFANRAAAEQAASKIRSRGLAGLVMEQK